MAAQDQALQTNSVNKVINEQNIILNMQNVTLNHIAVECDALAQKPYTLWGHDRVVKVVHFQC